MEKFNIIQLLNKAETKVNSTMLSNIRKTEINLILLEIKKLAIDYTPCCTELNRPLANCKIRWYDNGECYCTKCDYTN